MHVSTLRAVQWERVSSDKNLPGGGKAEVAYFTDLTPHFDCSNTKKEGVRQQRHVNRSSAEKEKSSKSELSLTSGYGQGDKDEKIQSEAEGVEVVEIVGVDRDSALPEIVESDVNERAESKESKEKKESKESKESKDGQKSDQKQQPLEEPIAELSNALFGLSIAPPVHAVSGKFDFQMAVTLY